MAQAVTIYLGGTRVGGTKKGPYTYKGSTVSGEDSSYEFPTLSVSPGKWQNKLIKVTKPVTKGSIGTDDPTTLFYDLKMIARNISISGYVEAANGSEALDQLFDFMYDLETIAGDVLIAYRDYLFQGQISDISPSDAPTAQYDRTNNSAIPTRIGLKIEMILGETK